MYADGAIVGRLRSRGRLSRLPVPTPVEAWASHMNPDPQFHLACLHREWQAFLGTITEALRDRAGDDLRSFDDRWKMVLAPDFEAKDDCLADVGQRIFDRFASRYASRDGRADDRVSARLLRREDHRQLYDGSTISGCPPVLAGITFSDSRCSPSGDRGARLQSPSGRRQCR